MNQDKFVKYLQKLVNDNFAGQKEFAVKIGVSPQYLSDVLNKRRDPGPKFLAALGFKKVVTYKRLTGL